MSAFTLFPRKKSSLAADMLAANQGVFPRSLSNDMASESPEAGGQLQFNPVTRVIPDIPEEALDMPRAARAPTALERMEEESRSMDAIPSRKQRLIGALAQAAGPILGGIFGGTEGAAGAAAGVNEFNRERQEGFEGRRKSLREEIAAEKDRLQREAEKRAQLNLSGQTLREQMEEHQRQQQRAQEQRGHEEKTLAEQIRHNKAVEDAGRRGATKVGEYVNEEGKQVFVFQEPDGQRSEQVFGKTQTKQDTSVTPYEDFRKQGGSVREYLNLTRPGAGNNDDALVDTILRNPALYDELNGTTKARIGPKLDKSGFTQFGKTMTADAMKKIAESESAIASLRDLRDTLVKNEQYIGPLSGLQAMNPWSDAKQAQATIDLVKQRVGKALEGGVLRKEDEEKYKKILATLQDTPATAIYKVDNLIKTLESDMNIFKEGQARGGRRQINAAPGVKSGPAPIVQKNPKNGQYRHSLDGGKTWQQGKPK